MAYKTIIDQQMDMLFPIGPQNLRKEQWSKDFTNDIRYFQASGYSNADGGRYNRNRCKNLCETLFNKEEERSLREACKSGCTAKCKSGILRKCDYVPTRASVCAERGLNADCTPKGNSVGFDFSVSNSGVSADITKSAASADGGSKTGLYIGIGLGIILIGAGAYILLRKSKK